MAAMKLYVFAIILLVSLSAWAVLPPKYQNLKDLDTMVSFIKAHDVVLSTLESIDLEDYTVQYNNGCTMYFGRKKGATPQGWAGPSEVLEFERSTCDIE